MRKPDPRLLAVVAAALAVFVVVGWWIWGARQHRLLEDAVTSAVSEAKAPLDALLAGRTAPEALDASAAALGRSYDALQAAANRSDPALLQSALQYLDVAREIARRSAAVRRAEASLAEAQAALDRHMAESGSRSKQWIDEAVKLRKAVQAVELERRIAYRTMVELLDGLRDAGARLARHARRAELFDEAARGAAQKKALAGAQ